MIPIFRATITILLLLVGAITVFAQKHNKPTITGQTPSPLTTTQGTPIAIELANLIVTDPDPEPVYPNGFSLEINNGKNYKVQGNVVTPDPTFFGMLTVDVRVSDGKNKSDKFGVKIDVEKTQNDAPKITGQQPLQVDQGGTLTLSLNNLFVNDPDNSYPQDFVMTVFAGKDYTFSGTTVTPTPGFSGQLKVPVSVNDGQNESNRFDVKIDVVKKQNTAPKITGQQPLSVNEGASLTLELGNLIVEDPGNTYPQGFSLKVFGGKDYTFNGTTVTPAPGFSGQLKVPVSVNDGQHESNRFDVKIDVIKKQNITPQITGQQSLSTNQGTSLTIVLTNLTVTDPDNTYPADFTLKVFPGNNYSFSGTTITPSADFTGQLTVPIAVNDGQNESKRFELKIDVNKKQNIAPQITGQQPLGMNQGASVTIELSHLIVTDPDNSYPSGFTLKISPGTNYTVSGNTITPTSTFNGTLTADVSVNDGQNESNVFALKVDVVKKQNVAPQITGHSELKINEDEAITLTLSQLQVTDPDNNYPQGFSIKISPGSNYQASGMTITPVSNYSGELSVPVVVSDGSSDSAPYNIKISVAPVNDAPVITGQNPLNTNKNALVSIPLSALVVSDPDNNYPTGFTLKILSGNNYSIAGNIVSPTIEFIGTLNVVVMVNDGKANSPTFNLKIEVIAPGNIAPTINGQRQVRTGQSTPLTVQLAHLLVTDPDNEYPQGFTLKVSPGADYTVAGNTITPAASIVNGTFAATVRVNDGKDDSPPFQLKIEVIPPTVKPRIISQKELRMPEDSTLTMRLTDLVVTDSDNPNYPAGFVLLVSPSGDGTYSRNGNSITPSPNFNGFLEVRVKVSDGTNVSDEFELAILVTPVNDPPEFVHADTTALAYDPGHDPLSIFETINIRDVDDDHLVLAEVGFEGDNYDPRNDQSIVSSEHSSIRAVHDSTGRLFLIGYATLEDYLDVLRHIQYNYVLTEDENGHTMDINRGPRIVYLTVSDGQLASATVRRKISMDLEISLDVPNAFTPNGDRQNDTWHIDVLNADKVDGARLRVYDKRGVLLYESIDFGQDWDGSFNGRMMPVDTYYYTIDLNLSYTRKRYRGTVVVLY